MPLKVDGDPGYGSVGGGAAPAPSGSPGGSETVPLLIPDMEPAGRGPSGSMSKEELEKAAGTPWWRKLRSRLLLLFWLGWLAMLCTAIAIIATSPRPVAPPLQWWQRALFYRMQPALLLSSTGDGTGGINGVRDRLPYLQSLGVGALVLEGLFPRDGPTSGLMQFNATLGTLTQFQQLVTEGHSAGVKILLDLCHLDLSDPVQRNGSTETPEPVQNALQFWLEQGVAGFGICDTDVAYSVQILQEWRAVVQDYDQDGHERILMVRQVWQPVPEFNDTSSVVNSSLVELVTQSLLPSSPHLLSTLEVAIAVETALLMPQRQWPSWTVGGAVPWELQRILMILSMTLPGTPVINYGEEISQTQNASMPGSLQHREAQIDMAGESKPCGRRAKRTALALFHSLSHSRSREEALLFGNFTFLPFSNSSSSSSEVYTNSSSPSSPLPSPPPPPPPGLLAFLRSWGCVHFLVLLNLGPNSHALDPSWAPSLPTGGVYVTSTGLDRVGALSLTTLTVNPQEAIVIKLFEGGSYS
ncbi:4F2 cell-surface antigen heavy chain isoform X1 [Anguilla anguilla]|uniref:4F2 cell-surface antigen heavy chain isoform X1 n=1 Tax=Anguilla anguilla TaxID=7936 RepID=UPI0015A9DBF1|nr:4F2 cell-surface antigen heavy chain isoform X1 [Anguilla anguilla]XP_035239973.1 4F2 cell-surface antigen heavy chain isoform X1 [Anguilla anguilla]XP_035239974.1 4F2 cell-surface antigen heavy chain isoform X1 [Anguilla anguilla]